ncbi:MAG: ACT domain-containing protein [Chloroflexota bacterium]
MGKVKAGGIIQNSKLALVGVMAVPDKPGVAGAILNTLAQTGINVQFIAQLLDLEGNAHVVFCVDRDVRVTSLAVLDEVKEQIGAREITLRGEVAIVSIFGPDFRERPGIAGAMFNALAAVDVNILSISTSISTVSCVIDHADVTLAIEALQEAFDLP